MFIGNIKIFDQLCRKDNLCPKILGYGFIKKLLLNHNMTNKNNKIFVWTEAFNCGELLPAFLKSYLAHNDYEINVYGFDNDLKNIDFTDPRMKLHNLQGVKFRNRPLATLVSNGYKSGHLGTAIFWAWLIKNRIEKHFVHLDADTIFLDNVINDFEFAIQNGFDLAGSRRPYRHRNYRRIGIDGWLLNKRKDCLNTDCFYFNTTSIKALPFRWLVRMIQGKRMGVLPVVDFFDPVIFKLLRKKKKILFLDSQDSGYYSKGELDSLFYQKRISFSAVGSGINFYKNPEIITSEGYKGFALASYSLYSQYILGIKIPVAPLDDIELKNKLKRLNLESWKLSR